ncbi:MAG: tripartite tricarboxylate transporter TctB family protein [Gammaproteobacteria bacterium]
MADSPNSHARGLSTRAMEISVALLMIGIGALVMVDSRRIGAGWADDGPQAGYFPFYIGLILSSASTVNLLRALLQRAAGKVFVDHRALRLVLAMLLPTTLFVAGIFWLGLYTAAALFIASFMLWQGGAGIIKALLVGLGVPLVLFLVFERWFLISLPKGPIETWLGL